MIVSGPEAGFAKVEAQMRRAPFRQPGETHRSFAARHRYARAFQLAERMRRTARQVTGEDAGEAQEVAAEAARLLAERWEACRRGGDATAERVGELFGTRGGQRATADPTGRRCGLQRTAFVARPGLGPARWKEPLPAPKTG